MIDQLSESEKALWATCLARIPTAGMPSAIQAQLWDKETRPWLDSRIEAVKSASSVLQGLVLGACDAGLAQICNGEDLLARAMYGLAKAGQLQPDEQARKALANELSHIQQTC